MTESADKLKLLKKCRRKTDLDKQRNEQIKKKRENTNKKLKYQ